MLLNTRWITIRSATIAALLITYCQTGYAARFYERLRRSPQETLSQVKLALELRQAVRRNGTPLIEGGHVTFVLDSVTAKQASVAGDWTMWRPSEMHPLGTTGLWWSTLDLPENARMEYKLVTETGMQLDPANPRIVPNGLGGQNSVFALRKYHPERRIERADAGHQGRIDSFVLGKGQPEIERNITVYLPLAYDKVTSTRFSTLYLNDGGDYQEKAMAVSIAENLIAERRIEPLILVFVPPKNRMAEYWRKTEEYTRFCVEQLVPEVDRRYRTLARSEARGIGGASLGGLVSLRIAWAHPEVFGKVLSQSGSFWTDDQAVDKMLTGKPSPKIRLWLDYGLFESELTEANRSLVKTLKTEGWAYREIVRPTAHNWTAWRDRLAEALQWLYPASR